MLEQLDVQLLGDNGLLGNQVLKFIVRSACDPCLGELSSRSLTRHLDHLALVIVGLAGRGRQSKEERGQLIPLKYVALVGFPDERVSLVCPLSGFFGVNPEHNHADTHILRRSYALTEIFVSTEKIGSRDSSLSGQRHKVTIDKRVNALLLASAQASQAQLHSGQAGDVQMVRRGYAIPGTVIPVRS